MSHSVRRIEGEELLAISHSLVAAVLNVVLFTASTGAASKTL